jgi:SPOR domain
MKFLNYICLLLLLIAFSTKSFAQNNAGGNVVLHADPRLSVLTNHVHRAEQQTASVMPSKPKTRTKITALTGSPAPESKVNKVVVGAVPATISKTDVKPLPGENGHAAGWTPPVYRKARSVSSGKGFRVQIYNGPDRNKAIAVKSDFMRLYPGVRTYLTYISPGFRVKVGDYRNRSDAAGMLKELNSVYNPSMIVPDIVNISTF